MAIKFVTKSQTQQQVPVALPSKGMKASADNLAAGKLVSLSTNQSLTPEQAEMVKVLATLKGELKEVKKKEADAEKARKDLSLFVTDAVPAAEEAVLTADGYVAKFSAAGNAKKVTDMHGLIGAIKDKVGYQGLLDLLKINMEDVAAILLPHEYSKFIQEVPGPRRLVSTDVPE